MTFSDLGLCTNVVEVIDKLGYQTPTPIQQAAIPQVLAGNDVMAGAQTGTGKTAAFALPLIHRYVTQSPCENTLRVLVLTPTRELAQQVHQSIMSYSQGLDITAVVAYGGVSINPQIKALNQGCNILVATPGRLLELAYKELIDLTTLHTLVLDEADRMLDMGFIIDIKRIIKRVPESRQTLFFSATFNDEILTLSKTLLQEPTLIEVADRNATAATIEESFYEVDSKRKAGALAYLIGSKNWQQVLIFTRTKHAADELANELIKDGISAVSVHGDKSQGARERGLADFKTTSVRALVATDVAARGLDIQHLQYVVNYELPYNAEDYIHRIGRTGRAGQNGIAVSLVSKKEQYLLEAIEELTGKHAIMQWVEGFEPNTIAPDVAGNSKRKPSKKALREKALGHKGSNNGKKRRPRRY